MVKVTSPLLRCAYTVSMVKPTSIDQRTVNGNRVAMPGCGKFGRGAGPVSASRRGFWVRWLEMLGLRARRFLAASASENREGILFFFRLSGGLCWSSKKGAK